MNLGVLALPSATLYDAASIQAADSRCVHCVYSWCLFCIVRLRCRLSGVIYVCDAGPSPAPPFDLKMLPAPSQHLRCCTVVIFAGFARVDVRRA
jgi:hypothetical protein